MFLSFVPPRIFTLSQIQEQPPLPAPEFPRTAAAVFATPGFQTGSHSSLEARGR